MRFNHRELAMYALSRQGKADREGCLWMKETDSRKRKKDGVCVQNYSWCMMVYVLGVYVRV